MNLIQMLFNSTKEFAKAKILKRKFNMFIDKNKIVFEENVLDFKERIEKEMQDGDFASAYNFFCRMRDYEDTSKLEDFRKYVLNEGYYESDTKASK